MSEPKRTGRRRVEAVEEDLVQQFAAEQTAAPTTKRKKGKRGRVRSEREFKTRYEDLNPAGETAEDLAEGTEAQYYEGHSLQTTPRRSVYSPRTLDSIREKVSMTPAGVGSSGLPWGMRPRDEGWRERHSAAELSDGLDFERPVEFGGAQAARRSATPDWDTADENEKLVMESDFGEMGFRAGGLGEEMESGPGARYGLDAFKDDAELQRLLALVEEADRELANSPTASRMLGRRGSAPETQAPDAIELGDGMGLAEDSVQHSGGSRERHLAESSLALQPPHKGRPTRAEKGGKGKQGGHRRRQAAEEAAAMEDTAVSLKGWDTVALKGRDGEEGVTRGEASLLPATPTGAVPRSSEYSYDFSPDVKKLLSGDSDEMLPAVGGDERPWEASSHSENHEVPAAAMERLELSDGDDEGQMPLRVQVGQPRRADASGCFDAASSSERKADVLETQSRRTPPQWRTSSPSEEDSALLASLMKDADSEARGTALDSVQEVNELDRIPENDIIFEDDAHPQTLKSILGDMAMPLSSPPSPGRTSGRTSSSPSQPDVQSYEPAGTEAVRRALTEPGENNELTNTARSPVVASVRATAEGSDMWDVPEIGVMDLGKHKRKTRRSRRGKTLAKEGGEGETLPSRGAATYEETGGSLFAQSDDLQQPQVVQNGVKKAELSPVDQSDIAEHIAASAEAPPPLDPTESDAEELGREAASEPAGRGADSMTLGVYVVSLHPTAGIVFVSHQHPATPTSLQRNDIVISCWQDAEPDSGAEARGEWRGVGRLYTEACIHPSTRSPSPSRTHSDPSPNGICPAGLVCPARAQKLPNRRHFRGSRRDRAARVAGA